MKLISVAVISCSALITGCVLNMTQSELRNQTFDNQYKSAKSSMAIASCVVGEWKKTATFLQEVQLRPTINGHSVWTEMVNGGVVFLADIDNVQGGSTTSLYIDPFLANNPNADFSAWKAALLKCFGDNNMNCRDDTDCRDGFSCRTPRNGGGWTECRAHDIQKPSTGQAKAVEQSTQATPSPVTQTIEQPILSKDDNNMNCRDDSGCTDGFSCRSKKGGGTECRAKGFGNTQQPPTVQAMTPEQSQPMPSPVIQPSEQPIQSNSPSDEYDEVKYTKRGGVYLIPVLINDVLQMKFVVDSGAADVNISPDVYLTLLKTGTIEKRDSLPGQHYQLADGSIVKSDRFIIRTLKIGNRVLKNVTCSISDSIYADMLLGQSALEQLGNFTFHHETGTVRFNK